MNKAKRFSLFLLVISSLVAATGCTTRHQAHPDVADRSTNFLGIVKSNHGTYAPESPTAFTLKTNELAADHGTRGDSVELFWGAINLRDY